MAKKTNEQKAPRIDDRREYVEELAKLDRVKSGLGAASRQLATVSSPAQATPGAKRYLSRSMNPMLGISDEALEQMAIELAAGGEITERIAKRIRAAGPDLKFLDEYDAESARKIMEAERFVTVFKRAIALQERRVLDQKKLALAEVCNAFRGERERIAREVASLTLRLVNAVNEENAFFERLRSQDEALPTMLSPGAFPIALHPDSPVCAWLALALQVSEAEAQKLMTNAGLAASLASA